MFNNFNELIENILNGSNTWIKSKNAFIFNDSERRIHIPFKHTFEMFTITNAEPEIILTREQKLVLLKAFLRVSFIEPTFLINDTNLQKELKCISLIDYAPNKNLCEIVFLSREIKTESEDKLLRIISRSESKINNNLFSTDFKVSIGERIGLEEYTTKLTNTTNIINSKEIPFFESKLLNLKKIIDKKVESLVLWDIENVNFMDDFSAITKKIKSKNQLKIVSFFKKHKSDKKTFYWGNLQFKLNKLKKRDWIIKTTKDSADNELIDNYYKYKSGLKELILITSDSDFKNIALDAKLNGISVKILNNSNRNNECWFEEFDYQKL